MASKHVCIHCLNPCEKSRDHVIPASWYPDNTRSSVQRWTVPSCRRCNQEFGKLENDLLLRLVLCIDPTSEAVSGLTNKALRCLGLDIPHGEISPQEVSRRQKLKEKLRRQLIPMDELAGKEGSIPGLNGDGRSQWAIPIPWAGLSIMAEKIARGSEFKLKQRYVEPPYGIATFVNEPSDVPEPFLSASKLHDLGPGCKIRRVFVTEDPQIVFYWITIWQALNFHVRIDLKKRLPVRSQEQQKGIVPDPERGAMTISEYLRSL